MHDVYQILGSLINIRIVEAFHYVYVCTGSLLIWFCAYFIITWILWIQLLYLLCSLKFVQYLFVFSYDLVAVTLELCSLLIFLMLFGFGISFRKIFNTGSLMQRPGTSLWFVLVQILRFCGMMQGIWSLILFISGLWIGILFKYLVLYDIYHCLPLHDCGLM